MQKTIYSVAALTPALLIAGGLDQSAQAQGTVQSLRVQQLYASLQGAVCDNDWNQALGAIAPLIGSPEITPEYRQALVQFRYQLEGWRAAKSSVPNVSGCNTASRPFEVTFQQDMGGLSSSTRTATRRFQQTVSVQQLYASMQGAVCQNDWNQALRVLSSLIGSPDITPDYRLQLVQFRHQLEEWRASRSIVEAIPNCRGIAAVPQPEETTRLVDWAS
jgi:hypothetical protein